MKKRNNLHVVTGGFGYSGKYIVKRLLDLGYEVITITGSPNRANPFGGKVEAYPYNFDNIEKLADSLRGASVLYNTYWVRFNHPDFTFSSAVRNTLRLFESAKIAGIKRIVHISITNPSEDSELEYFRSKARLEYALAKSGLSYVILRPAVIFGKEDILINNIAWCLRRFPFFLVPGDGNYRLQPIYVDDLAKLCVEEGQKSQNNIINAIGPETFTYRELVETIGKLIGKKRRIISANPLVCYFAAKIIGKILNDVMITRDEIKGLTSNLLYTDSPPVGETRLTDWIKRNSSTLGIRYRSELVRRKNRKESYCMI